MTLSTERKTAIIEERVDRMLDRILDRAKAINQDGGLPGDLMLPGPQRLEQYWRYTPDLSDLPLLIDGKESEEMIRQGLVPPPVNPYWLNQLSIPGQFTELAQDFMSLNAQYADRYEVA